MSYHMDNEVNSAIINLLDRLCEWERNTGRRSTLVFIPHCDEERLVVAQDGKPFPQADTTAYVAKMVFDLALKERNPIEKAFTFAEGEEDKDEAE